MTVQAKFYVKEIRRLHAPGDPVAEIVMSPVFGTYGDGTANETWSKYTPSGELKMTITNPAAIEQFDLGKAYLLTFTPAETVQA